jgi:hypothetical protein
LSSVGWHSPGSGWNHRIRVVALLRGWSAIIVWAVIVAVHGRVSIFDQTLFGGRDRPWWSIVIGGMLRPSTAPRSRASTAILVDNLLGLLLGLVFLVRTSHGCTTKTSSNDRQCLPDSAAGTFFAVSGSRLTPGMFDQSRNHGTTGTSFCNGVSAMFGVTSIIRRSIRIVFQA